MRVSRKNRRPEKPNPKRKAAAHTPHDALFHYTFGNVEHARPAIASMLPARVAKQIDFATLAVVNGHFVDPELAQSATDLLFDATIAGRSGKIYVLFEHQSSSEHLMLLRLLRYLLRIWDVYVGENPETKTLPVIIPMVLHHSPSGWTSPLRFEELFDIDDDGLQDVADFVPRFGMVLQDISHATDEELMSRALTGLARVTLLLFRHARSARNATEICERLANYSELVENVFQAPNGLRALVAVMRYIQSVTHASAKEVRMAMQRSDLIDEETYKDIRFPGWREDEAFEKGIEKGVEKGMTEGLKIGMTEALRGMLLGQLEDRFGKVPAWATKRVVTAEIVELSEMGRKVVRAQTISDVVGTKDAGTKAKKSTPRKQSASRASRRP